MTNDLPVPRRDLESMINSQIQELKVAGQLYSFRPETNCRICRDEDSRALVNTLLKNAISYRSILDACENINSTRKKNAKITYNSIFTHAHKHFNVQDPANAIIRQTLEERSRQQELNFVEAIGSILTPYAYLEVVASKGFEALVSPEATISAEMGMQAIIKLWEMQKKDEGVQQAAELIHENNKIISAVKEIVPEEYYAAILAKLEGKDVPRPNVVDVEEVDDDDGYDPAPEPDEDDEF
jgi:hypothetical protein